MSSRVARVVAGFAIGVAGLVASSVLVPTQAEAQGTTSINPCPAFSIQQVFNDPNGDWDYDGVSNWDELYGGTRPCQHDNPNKPVDARCSSLPWSPNAANADPNGDWDHDGITNVVEVRNGANPCAAPCPYPTRADLAIDPNGDWDDDRVSNAVEVHLGTNPCRRASQTVYTYNPCPHWTQLDVARMPNLDWDRDGRTNSYEASRGFNPCGRTVVVAPAPPPTVVDRPPPGYRCPVGYPYYYSRTGLCYTHPVTRY